MISITLRNCTNCASGMSRSAYFSGLVSQCLQIEESGLLLVARKNIFRSRHNRNRTLYDIDIDPRKHAKTISIALMPSKSSQAGSMSFATV